MNKTRAIFTFLVVLLLAGPLAGPALSLEQAGVPLVTPEIIFHHETGSAGPRTLYGDDVLLADRDPDIEGNPDMVSSDTWGMFLVWESMDPDNTHIYLYRSTDGGSSWSYFADVVGGVVGEIRNPALALPEHTQDYLYLVYDFANQIQVCRVNLSTLDHSYSNVGTSVYGVHHPRITTDDWDYPGNYWVYVTFVAATDVGGEIGYIVRVARSTDDAVTWERHTDLFTTYPGGPLPKPDIAYGETTVHVTWDGAVAASSTVRDIYVARSTDLAYSWGSSQNLTTTWSQSCYWPRVAAIHGDGVSGGEVVVAYTMAYTAEDLDVWFSLSEDKGAGWLGPYCLACSGSLDEAAPDVDADPSYGWFHVAYWQNYNINYKSAHRSDPMTWSSPVTVSDTGQASWGYAPPTSAYDWAGSARGVAWSDFRTPTYGVYFDRQDWTPHTQTVACSYSCDPSSGILPFATQMSVSMFNLYTGQLRRIAGHIDVYFSGGQAFGNWRAGWTNISPGGNYSTAWPQNLPAIPSLVGSNYFQLIVEDVTPAPYNQPPYPAAGDTASGICTVVGNQP